MNDRYLFKAKLKKCELFPEAQQWVQGYYVHTAESDYIVSPYEHTTLLGEGEAVEIEVNTLCQCTGVPDKNRIMIYENDIVWDSEERKFYKIIFSKEDMCYYAQDADGYKHTFESCYLSSIEVESNIFDNPQLLEVGE